MKKIITTGVALGLLLFLCLPLQAQRYKDPGAPVEERVADLLARMTLEEKIAQMNMHSLRNLKYDEKGEPFPESLDEVFGPDGIGFLESPFLDVDEVARAGCLADRYHREQTRLGIPPHSGGGVPSWPAGVGCHHLPTGDCPRLYLEPRPDPPAGRGDCPGGLGRRCRHGALPAVRPDQGSPFRQGRGVLQ